MGHLKLPHFSSHNCTVFMGFQKVGILHVPMLCLLPDKRANMCIELSRQLQQLTNNVIPADLNIDFERGMIGAILQVYPLCPIYGCLFHLSKNVYKQVQQLGLQQMYQEDELLRENIRMIPSLSFVPVQDTVAAFDHLTQHCGIAEKPVFNYFECAYIGEVCGGQRLPPTFPRVLWNVNTHILNNLPRTTNHLEGWHNRVSGMFNYDHPSIWEHGNMFLAQMTAGAPPPRKRIYRDVDTRLQRLVEGHQLPQVIPFLRGVSFNLACF